MLGICVGLHVSLCFQIVCMFLCQDFVLGIVEVYRFVWFLFSTAAIAAFKCTLYNTSGAQMLTGAITINVFWGMGGRRQEREVEWDAATAESQH